MKYSQAHLPISKLYQMFQSQVFNFDLVIQRKSNIWDLKRKSLLIHSIISGFVIPPVYAIKEKRILHFIDGKQRLTTIFDYIDNNFELCKEIPKYSDYELAGKKFSDLPEELQEKIKNYEIEVIKIEDVTSNEIEDLFFRLNNGMPLKTIETTRAILGSRIIKFIESIAGTPFFSKKVNISKSAKQRYVDQELILQTLMLIHGADTGFSGKEIQEFAKLLKNNELRTELMAKMQNSCYFLNEAFTKKEKFLRKIHIPMIFKLVYDIQKNGWLITPKDFYKWSIEFFSNIPAEYQLAMLSGSAKKENVKKRINIISEHFYNYFRDRIQNNFNNQNETNSDANKTDENNLTNNEEIATTNE